MAVYGFDFDGLDARWADMEPAPAADNRNGGPSEEPSGPLEVPSRPVDSPDRPSPFLFSSSWLIIGISLAVIAALVVRSVNLRLKPARPAWYDE